MATSSGFLEDRIKITGAVGHTLKFIFAAKTSNLPIIATHTVPEGAVLQRIVDYSNGLFEQIPSRKGAKKAVERGLIRLNGEKVETSRYISAGDRIELIEKDTADFKVFYLKVAILYEDDHMAVVHKPAGLPVSGNRYRTLAQALPYNLAPSAAADALRVPLPVHRIDAATSGLVVAAKSASAMVALGRYFEARKISKTYHALAAGMLPERGQIDSPIQGKPALTIYERCEEVPSLRHGAMTLVKLHPHTGRTHQLRIHLAGINRHIIGDPIYSPVANRLKGKGLFLCATALSLPHPVYPKKEVHASIAIPAKFCTLLRRSEEAWQRFHGK